MRDWRVPIGIASHSSIRHCRNSSKFVGCTILLISPLEISPKKKIFHIKNQPCIFLLKFGTCKEKPIFNSTLQTQLPLLNLDHSGARYARLQSKWKITISTFLDVFFLNKALVWIITVWGLIGRPCVPIMGAAIREAGWNWLQRCCAVMYWSCLLEVTRGLPDRVIEDNLSGILYRCSNEVGSGWLPLSTQNDEQRALDQSQFPAFQVRALFAAYSDEAFWFSRWGIDRRNKEKKLTNSEYYPFIRGQENGETHF